MATTFFQKLGILLNLLRSFGWAAADCVITWHLAQSMIYDVVVMVCLLNRRVKNSMYSIGRTAVGGAAR
jgi:hypothetical protein